MTVSLNSDVIRNSGGSLDIKSFQDDKYIITKLSKGVTSGGVAVDVSDAAATAAATELTPWLRSVIWERASDSTDNVSYLPVCVSPPREWDLSGNFQSNNTLLEDFVEGTMINVFVTKSHPEPQVATRSSLGATGTFFSKRNFMELFQDALVAEGRTLDGASFPLEGAAPRNVVAHFWSFVLQHPENRFVGVVKKPGLVLVHEGWTTEDGTVTIHQRPGWTSWQLPVKYECELTEEAIRLRMSELSELYGPTWQGLVLRRDDGGRMKFVPPAYSRLRSWRAEPRQDVRLLWLITESSSIMAEYMTYFSEDLERFLELNTTVERISRELYHTYQEVHIRRVKKLDEAKDYLRPHVFTLHGKYLNNLKPKGWFVRMKEVRDYIGELPWQRLNYIVRRLEGKIDRPAVAGAPAVPAAVAV